MPIVVTNFISLDGVIQSVLSPDEDTDGGFTQGGWVSDHMDDEVAAFMASATTRASAMLLGRRTYEGFARAWGGASAGDRAVGDHEPDAEIRRLADPDHGQLDQHPHSWPRP